MENVSLRFMAVVEEMETGFYIFLQIFTCVKIQNLFTNYQILEYIWVRDHLRVKADV